MDTKLEARGQFPASFPDTFKNFFAMMNEDEDHVGLFANLLEDKVIPRQNSSMQPQRQRCGGSLRSHSGGDRADRGDRAERRYQQQLQKQQQQLQQQQQQQAQQQHPQQPHIQQHNMSVYPMRGRSGSGSGAELMMSRDARYGATSGSRSNSLRLNRQRGSSISFSQNGLNRLGFGPVLLGPNVSSSSSGSLIDVAMGVGGSDGAIGGDLPAVFNSQRSAAGGSGGGGSSGNQKAVTGSSKAERGCGGSLGGSSSGGGGLLCKHIKYCCLHQNPSQSPSVDGRMESQQQQQQQQQQPKQMLVSLPCDCHLQYQQQQQQQKRMGPDGEDNGGGKPLKGYGYGYAPVPAPIPAPAVSVGLPKSSSSDEPGSSVAAAAKERLERIERQEKRHSTILERAFDFDASCDESDSICSSTPGPVPSPAPHQLAYNVLKPILKQPQQQQQPPQQLQQPVPHVVHRLLPTPPTHGGLGAFHTREAALQRVQQQSGFGSRPNLTPAGGNYIQGPSTSSAAGYNAGYNVQQEQQRSQYDYEPQEQQDYIQQEPQNPQDQYLEYDREWESQEASTAPALSTYGDFLNAAQNPTGSRQSLRAQKSPILNRRRASSIAANCLHSDYTGYARNSIGGAPLGSEDLQRISHSSSARDRMSLAGVLTFQQAMSGAVSPQYGTVGSLNPPGTGDLMMPGPGSGGGLLGGSSLNVTVGVGLLGGSSTTLAAVAEVTSGPDATDSPTGDSSDSLSPISEAMGGAGSKLQQKKKRQQQQMQRPQHVPTHLPRERERGVGESSGASTSVSTLAAAVVAASHPPGSRILAERQRLRTSSMPAESRRPRLAEMRRSAIHAGDLDMEYYRLRSFSITSHGVCNLGDSLRSRRSRSINSVTSTGTSNSGVDRHNSNASRVSGEVIDGDPGAQGQQQNGTPPVPAYKVAMLGSSGVGKTTLTYQFTTSDYICAYDLSLDDDYGQKTVSVLVDNIETDLEIIDHPACEMSTEAFCATYNIDLFVVVYSVVDKNTFKAAERVLQYLKENEMLLTRGAILVGNKTDLERHREVSRQMGRKVAKEIACKFIETSSGLDHNVDELLVGVVAQVKLNPQRLRLLTELELQRLNLQSTIQKHRGMHLPLRRMVRQMSVCQGEEETLGGFEDLAMQMRGGERVDNPNRRPLNLESILRMGGESDLEEGGTSSGVSIGRLGKFEILAASLRHRHPFRKRRSFDGATTTSAAAAALAELQRRQQLRAVDDSQLGARREERYGAVRDGGADSDDEEDGDGNGGGGRRSSCNRKVVKKLTARTKVFISSVLRFKKAINLKRRNSSSCSDLFVI
ncbi:uncharacterized protein [Drosophila bipectinata]|uniref:uncharacterized protein n=1 Tax=Drosophila bipectinata TaxID=42026 RepID=UPI0038B277F4